MYKMKLRKLLILTVFFVHKVSCQKEGSLVFVIDNTSSMRTDIEYVKHGIDGIMDAILKKTKSQIEHFVLVTFNNTSYKKLITTSDIRSMKKVLHNIRAGNTRRSTKDCSKMSLSGVKLALQSSKNHSNLFVFTDSSPKDSKLTKEVIQLAQKKSSQVQFIITKENYCKERPSMFNPYYEIANATYGQVLKVNATKKEVNKILNYIAETCTGERTVLVQTDIPAHKKQRVTFYIDDQTEYVVISASGNRVEMDWKDIPNFKIDVGGITLLDDFKAVNLLVPKPGRYSVTVWGASVTFVIVYGKTSFNFNYGFSMSPVRSLRDTMKNPTAGEKHLLAILVNDSNQAVSVDAVELLDLNKKVLTKLSLSRRSSGFYTTKFFLPPISTFRIAVLGKGKYLQRPIKRISETVIQPKIKEFGPIVTVSKVKDTYEYNSKLYLNCNVKGHPEPQIKWKDEKGTIIINATSKHYPPYNYSTHFTVTMVKKSQRYTCYAQNKLGKNSQDVFVKVDPPFVVNKHLIGPIVTVDQINKTYEYNSTLHLNCYVKGYPKPEIKWTDENGTILRNQSIKENLSYNYSNHLTIEKLKKSQHYICHAQNQIGENNKYVFVKVGSPFVVKKHLENITYVSFNKDIELICDIKSKWHMKITWWKNGKLVTSSVSNGGTKLTINKVNIRDHDTYICKAELLQDGLILLYETKLKTKELKPIVTVGQIKKTYEYNSKLYLNCNVKGYPKPQIKWTDENGMIFRNPIIQEYPPYDYSNQVTIDKLKKSQRYTCHAQNYLGENSKYVIVNVDSPFVVTKHIENVTYVPYEKEIGLICDIKSKWPMKITWWKKDKLVTSLVSNNGTKLTIKKVNIEDQDTYNCTAELLEGGWILTYQTKLEINELKPIVTIDKIKKNYEYNSPLYLNCNVKGLPKPQTKWIDQNGVPLTNMVIKKNYPYDYSYQVTVDKVKKSQSYTCNAQNKFGTNSKNVFVNVDSAFVVSKHIEGITYAAYEKDIEFICDIKSKWQMRITWWKNDKQVTSHISNDGTKLTIKKVKKDDQGKYICRVELLKDNVTRSYQTELKISGLISPQIEKPATFLIVKKAEPVTLTCKITKGFPAPKRVWKFKEIGSDKWIVIKNAEERLTIERSQLSSGDYKCLASNDIGHDEMDIHLVVEAPPEIVSSQRTVSALELDLVLRIPCETFGYPIPTVTWRVNGSIIGIGAKYNLDKRTLVILNPVKHDSANYTCEVQNQFGSDSKTIEAIVKSNAFIINPRSNETTEAKLSSYRIEKKEQSKEYNILDGSIISLNCLHANNDTVRWYKDDQYLNITEPSLVIMKATTNDDGTYNCRVSNYYGTESYSFKINVGYEPRGNTEPVIINKDGNLNQTLSKSLECKFDVKPMTNEIEWTFNGERIYENTTDFNGEINWGIYTCSITNRHGTANRTFTVVSHDCLIKKSQITKNVPLILTEDSTWPDIYYNENYLRVSRNTSSKLFCSKQKENNVNFESFSKNNEILATCVGEKNFSVNGTIIKFEDLQCNLPIRHIINNTGATCLHENTELVKVGFEVDQFVKVYEVCVDKTKMVTLYTRIDMTPLFNVKNAQFGNFSTARVNEIIGDKCGETSKCCFGKTQLVSEHDVRYGPSQAATFIEMNYVPYWRPCDGQLGWNDIEENITRKLEQIKGQFIIWSGASNYTMKNDVTVPRYLWKVIKIVDTESSFSFVYVNDPNPTVEDKLCKDICNQFDWITSSYSTYCCRLEEFRKAFHIPENLQ